MPSPKHLLDLPDGHAVRGGRSGLWAGRLLLLLGVALGACPAQKRPMPLRDDMGPLDESNVRSLLARHRGKPLLLSFWATYCPPCDHELPVLARFRKRHPEVTVVLVTLDDRDGLRRARATLDRLQLGPPRYRYAARRLRDFTRAAGIPWTGALPASFWFDAHGTLRHAHLGPVTADLLAAWQSGHAPRARPASGRARALPNGRPTAGGRPRTRRPRTSP